MKRAGSTVNERVKDVFVWWASIDRQVGELLKTLRELVIPESDGALYEFKQFIGDRFGNVINGVILFLTRKNERLDDSLDGIRVLARCSIGVYAAFFTCPTVNYCLHRVLLANLDASLLAKLTIVVARHFILYSYRPGYVSPPNVAQYGETNVFDGFQAVGNNASTSETLVNKTTDFALSLHLLAVPGVSSKLPVCSFSELDKAASKKKADAVSNAPHTRV